MARRPTKLEFHEHPVTCPYCRPDVTVYSLMDALRNEAATKHRDSAFTIVRRALVPGSVFQ